MLVYLIQSEVFVLQFSSALQLFLGERMSTPKVQQLFSCSSFRLIQFSYSHFVDSDYFNTLSSVEPSFVNVQSSSSLLDFFFFSFLVVVVVGERVCLLLFVCLFLFCSTGSYFLLLPIIFTNHHRGSLPFLPFYSLEALPLKDCLFM